MNKFRLPETFLAKLKAASINPAFLLRKSSLPSTLCSSGDGIISPDQFFRLCHTLEKVSENPAIGLRLATLNPPCHLANIAARHARTFGDALPHLARSTALWFSEHNEAAPAVFLDLAFALVHETGRRGTQQPLHPLRVELTRKASHQEIYEAHYGCRVRFKARRNSIVFRTGDLQLPFATYNAELLAILGPKYDREIARLKARQTTSSRAKWVLKRVLGGQYPDIYEVAKALRMSTRTLQRRIAEEGSSFRDLLSDARRELARLSLQHPSLGLSKTASLLGYEDPNSFLRAFRMWEGVTPSEWKAMEKAGLQQTRAGLTSPRLENAFRSPEIPL
jgi:AraC-like DNA-binding protein